MPGGQPEACVLRRTLTRRVGENYWRMSKAVPPARSASSPPSFLFRRKEPGGIGWVGGWVGGRQPFLPGLTKVTRSCLVTRNTLSDLTGCSQKHFKEV